MADNKLDIKAFLDKDEQKDLSRNKDKIGWVCSK